MGSLFSYSGLTTKIKAMKRNLLTDSQYREMAALDSVAGSVEYLKKQPSYQHILTQTDAGQMHRSDIEELLLQAEYRDFSKLYRFANLSQRKFLDLYFMHYEISILKRCLRNLMGGQPMTLKLYHFQAFFERHSQLDVIKLTAAKNLSEFTANLSGTPYYALLMQLNLQENLTVFDYEMQLDFLYFKTMWRMKNKQLKGKEQQMITQCFGSRLDMLNIQWIYRCLRYYSMTPEEIMALLIPVFWHLKPEQMKKLASCTSLEEFFSLLKTTRYGTLNLANLEEQPNPEKLSLQVLARIHHLTALHEPYSVASLNSYLYFKELEIHRIITIIESIRYGLGQQQILNRLENVM